MLLDNGPHFEKQESMPNFDLIGLSWGTWEESKATPCLASVSLGLCVWLSPRAVMPIIVRTIGLGHDPTMHVSADLTAYGNLAANCHSSLEH